ncbi:MAG: hypothetical protein ACXVP0_14860 [Bacteroidia bacterium]
MQILARTVSVIFHPLLMCSYGSLIFFFGFKGSVIDFVMLPRLKLVLTSMIFCFTFLLPLINVYILYRLKRVSTFTIEDQKERTFPYVVTACFYFGLFYLFMGLNILPHIKMLIFGAGTAILLTALINMRYKISAHMVGLGGLLSAIILVAFALRYNAVFMVCTILLITGLTGSGRLYLKAHRPSQIYTGFFLGFVTQVFVFFLLQILNFN